jgi:putative oxidoreductase
MQTAFSQTCISFGRVLMALYFLVPGAMKLLDPHTQLAMMVHHQVPMPSPLLMIAGIVQVLGAALLMFNRHVRAVSVGFVIYILIINFTMHDFWHFTDLEAMHEVQNFIKNLGILAGLLAMAGYSVGRPLSWREVLRSDASFAK